MNDQEATEIIEDLRQQVAWMNETLANLPPTLPQSLELHAKWLRQEEGGVRLDLTNANLSGVLMCGANLAGADFTDAKCISTFADREGVRSKKPPRSLE